MANSIQLILDDTSPDIVYAPFRDTFGSPQTSLGWNPYYSLSGFASAQGQIGQGVSYHITSLDGAALALQWHGTAVQLFGNATQANYSISIDGQSVQPNPSVADNVLAYISHLPNTNHSLTLSVQIPSTPNNSSLAFDKAVISATPAGNDTNQTFSLQPLNDSDIAFLGDWSFKSYNTPDAQSIPFHQSTTAGDRVSTSFYGAAFIVSGTISPSASLFAVTLNSSSHDITTSSVTTTLSARSSFTQYNTSLFTATGLNASELYSVEVLNVDGGLLQLDVGGFVVAQSSPLNPPSNPPPFVSSSISNNASYSPGTLAALALAGILLFVILSSALFYFFYWRPRVERKRRERRARRRRQPQPAQVVDIRRDNHSDQSSWRKRFRLGLPQATQEGKEKTAEALASGPPRTTSPRHTEEGKLALSQTASSPARSSLELPIAPALPPSARVRESPRSVPLPPRPLSGLDSLSSASPNIYFSTVGGIDITDQDIHPGSAPHTASVTQPFQDIIPSQHASPHHSIRSRNSSTPRGGRRSGSSALLLTVDGAPQPASPASPGGDDDELEYIDDIDESLRELSPRTSEVTFGVGTRSGMRIQPRWRSLQSQAPTIEPPFPSDAASGQEPSFPSDVTSEGEGGRNPSGDSFLSVRESSPFRVDFPQPPRSARASRLTGTDGPRSRMSGQSRVRFQDDPETAEPLPTSQNKEGGNGDSDRNNGSQPPPILRFASPASDRDRRAVVSFLEFGNSSPSGSLRTHSSSGDSKPPERSRWSSTTSQSVGTADPSLGTTNVSLASDSRPSTAPQHSTHSFPFPFAVVGPSSHPYDSRHHAQPFHVFPTTHIHHPFSDPSASASFPSASSTDSVPMSVSDIRFRHSDSDDGVNANSRRTSTASHLPPHPPLPSPRLPQPPPPPPLLLQLQQPQPQQQQQQQQPQPQSQQQQQQQSGLSFGSIAPGIVERVLGLRHPAPADSSTGGRAPPGR